MGYKLADGSYSTEYELGDKFMVTHNLYDQAVFSRGSIVSLYEEDNSDQPLFKLEEGEAVFSNCDGDAGGYCYWFCLTPVKLLD